MKARPRPRRKRALLLQLPVQSHDYAYSAENQPLAVGLLSAWARRALPDWEVELAPARLVDDGGDAALLEGLLRERPDVVGLSCAVWNVERSLALARALKRRQRSLFVVLGGPEIALDNELVSSSRAFAAAVVGEGEASFAELLSALSQKSRLNRIPGLLLPSRGGWTGTAPRAPIEPLDRLASPYLDGVLGPSKAGSIALETVRGCPQRCAYCHYHKSFARLRAFDLGRLERELRWAREAGVREVTFVDPCFARRPAMEQLLSLLARVGAGKIEFRCELNAEDVTAALARMLGRAGIREVEVGLQTTNPRALKLAQRPFQPARFIEGVRRLRGEGIRVLLDVMVGLPGDALADVQRSVDFAVQGELFDDLKAYPLCVLPGTVFRRRARELAIEHQREPPYHVLRTPTMSADDIRSALEYAESAVDADLFPIEIPRKFGIVVRPDSALEPVARQSVGQALAIEVRDPAWRERLPELGRALLPALEANPYSLVSWLLPSEPFPRAADLRRLARLAPRAPHVVDRDWFATHNPIRSTQIFVRFPAALVRLPSPDDEGPRACWIAFTRRLSRAAEERLVDDLEQRFAFDPQVWFRIGARP